MANGLLAVRLATAAGVILATILTVSSQTCDTSEEMSKGFDLEVQTIPLNISSHIYTRTVRCEFRSRLAGMKIVNDLRVRVFDPCSRDRVFYQLASIKSNKKKPELMMEIEDSRPQVSGKIAQSRLSHLSLSWNLTNLDVNRAYQCVAIGKNMAGKYMSISQTKIDRASSEVGVDGDQILLIMDAVKNLQEKTVEIVDNQTRHIDEGMETQIAHINERLGVQTEHIDGMLEKQTAHIDGMLEKQTAHSDREIEKLAEYTDGKIREQTVYIGVKMDTQTGHIDERLEHQATHTSGLIKNQTVHIDVKLASLETYIRQSFEAFNNCMSSEDLSKEIESHHEAFIAWFTVLGSKFESFDFSTVYNNRVYLVSKTRAKFNIDTADQVCGQIGGYLVELDDDDEFLFVSNFVKRIGGSSDFYTGTNDIAVEGRFVHKRSGKPLTINKWNAGQPDNWAGKEDCVEINTNMSGNLNDVPCWIEGKYVCEIPLPSVSIKAA